jgi:hypothetical protein
VAAIYRSRVLFPSFLHVNCITSGAVSKQLDVKIHSHRHLCNFGSRTPLWSFPKEFYVSRLNVISKRHSKDLAIVVTRRESCLSVRDCCGVCCWLSVAYAVFNQPLSQWLCRREGNSNHPPIIWELMCHTHTLDGSFVFLRKTALPFYTSCPILLRGFFFSSAVFAGLFLLCQNRCCRCQCRF